MGPTLSSFYCFIISDAPTFFYLRDPPLKKYNTILSQRAGTSSRKDYFITRPHEVTTFSDPTKAIPEGRLCSLIGRPSLSQRATKPIPEGTVEFVNS